MHFIKFLILIIFKNTNGYWNIVRSLYFQFKSGSSLFNHIENQTKRFLSRFFNNISPFKSHKLIQNIILTILYTKTIIIINNGFAETTMECCRTILSVINILMHMRLICYSVILLKSRTIIITLTALPTTLLNIIFKI